MRFWTETGSAYEVRGGAIRRLSGTHDPTPNQGEDGRFQCFVNMSPIHRGLPVWILWDYDGRALPQRVTQTSRVVRIERANAVGWCWLGDELSDIPWELQTGGFLCHHASCREMTRDAAA